MPCELRGEPLGLPLLKMKTGIERQGLERVVRVMVQEGLLLEVAASGRTMFFYVSDATRVDGRGKGRFWFYEHTILYHRKRLGVRPQSVLGILHARLLQACHPKNGRGGRSGRGTNVEGRWASDCVRHANH